MKAVLRAAVVVTAAFVVFGPQPAAAQVADDHRLAGSIQPNQTFAQANDLYTSTGDPLAPASMEMCGTAPATHQIDRAF